MRYRPDIDGHDLIGISTRRIGAAVVVAVVGEVDVHSGPRLRTALDEVLDEDDDRPVVLDLSEVGLLSSTGLAVLVDTHRQAQQRGRSFVLVVHPRRRAVSLALHTAGLAGLLTTCTGVEEAVRLGA